MDRNSMLTKYYWCLLLLCFGLSNDAAAQRFGAGVIVGLTGSQINGDQVAGFDKLGFTAGLRGVVYVSDRIDVSTELLYSQRGSQSELIQGNTVAFPFKISTNYIEVPVLFNIQDWLDTETEEFYKLHFHAGFSYGRLINSSVEDESNVSPLVRLQDLFNKNDYSWIAGATFYLNKHLGFTGRYTRSINLLYRNSPDSPINARSLRGFFLTFQVLYMF